MDKKGDYIEFKKYEKKSPFITSVDFESILVPEDNRKQNWEESLQTNIKNIWLVVKAIN